MSVLVSPPLPSEGHTPPDPWYSLLGSTRSSSPWPAPGHQEEGEQGSHLGMWPPPSRAATSCLRPSSKALVERGEEEEGEVEKGEEGAGEEVWPR